MHVAYASRAVIKHLVAEGHTVIGTVRNVGYRFNVYEDDAPPPRERADA